MKKNSGTTLSLPKIYGYGLGEFGFNFFLVFISYHLMYFLTDVAQFPTKTAADIYTIVQWLESLSLLAAGFIIDRLRIPGGRYRPWLLIGSVTCMAGMVLFFTRLDMPVPLYSFVFPALYLLAYWGYNFMWVGYRSIMGFVAQNPNDNVALTTAASQMGTVSMLVFSVAGERILYAFTDLSSGYTLSATIYGGLMVLSMLIVFRITRPYDRVPLDYAARTAPRKKEKRISLRDAWETVKGPMIPFFLAFVLRTCIQMLIPALIIYHFQYALNDPAGVQIYLLCYTLGQLVGLFFVRFVAAKIGKRNTFIASSLGTLILLLAAWTVSGQMVPFLVIMTVNAFVTSFGSSLLPAFLTDIADYNEYERGLSTRSFAVSLGATSITVASLVGGGIAAYGLAATGYDGTLAVQLPSTIQNITGLMLVGGAAFALASAIPMFFYKLDESKLTVAYEKRSAQQGLDAQAK